MSGLSVAVVALGLRASNAPSLAPLAVRPAGIVPAATPTRRPTADPTSGPTGSRTSVASQSEAPSRPGVSAAPVRTNPAAVHGAGHHQPPPRPKPSATARPSLSAGPAPQPDPSPNSVTVTGAAADTKYGPVRVQITLTDGRIVRSDAIVYPQDTNRDKSINDNAVPDLDQETLQAQSSQIDTVSGATYTSQGYRLSLQSALDAAHAG